MDSLKVLKYHVIIFKLFGLWPSENPSIWSRLHSFFVITVIFIGFPGTLFLSMTFVSSLQQVVDILVITSSLAMAGIKGVNVFYQKWKLIEIFKIIKELDRDCDYDIEKKYFTDIFKESKLLFRLFMWAYLLAWTFLGLQSVGSKRGQGLWLSTSLFPFKFAEDKTLFYIVLVHQGISNFCICIIDATVDTYAVILSHILGGHVEVLGLRLRSVCDVNDMNGLSKEPKSKEEDTKWTVNFDLLCIDRLRRCVEKYQMCLR